MITRLVQGPSGPITQDIESTIVETVEHKGFVVQVHQLAIQSRFQFMPLVLKGDTIVRRIFVRSKKPEVSLRFGRRAVDHFVKTGDWPAKQGVTIG